MFCDVLNLPKKKVVLKESHLRPQVWDAELAETRSSGCRGPAGKPSTGGISPSKMVELTIKNGELTIKNGELTIKNGGFHHQKWWS